jgi:hypothetical protein
MKKYVLAGLLATTMLSPAFAQSKFVPNSPADPLHRRTVAICALVLVALQAYAKRGALPGDTNR